MSWFTLGHRYTQASVLNINNVTLIAQTLFRTLYWSIATTDVLCGSRPPSDFCHPKICMCIEYKSYLERKKCVNGPVSKRKLQVSAVGFLWPRVDTRPLTCWPIWGCDTIKFCIFAGWHTMEPAGSRSAVRNIKDEATRKKVILVEKERTKTVR